MSARTQSADDASDRDRRVLLARKDLYPSGNSLAVSIPPDTIENTAFEVGDQANVFSLIAHRELAITADTRRYYDRDDATARGSYKIRESSHGTVMLTVPKKALLKDLGYGSLEDARGVEVRVTIDPFTSDLFVEFPDE